MTKVELLEDIKSRLEDLKIEIMGEGYKDGISESSEDGYAISEIDDIIFDINHCIGHL
jgi:hypothetical protein